MSSAYAPPTGSAMRATQNTNEVLRLLITQRRLYSRAKRIQSVRWFGLLVIGLAAPVVTVVEPSLAVGVGALAGAWLFLGRTLLVVGEGRLTSKAAALQDKLDRQIFAMPTTVERSDLPTLEDVAKVLGDIDVPSVAAEDGLVDWYDIDAATPGVKFVAIAQRMNVAYSDQLLRSTVLLWTIVAIVWCAALIILSLVVGLSLTTFLLGVFLPALPAALDVGVYIRSIARASRDRRDVAKAIEKRLASTAEPVKSEDLLAWQDLMFGLRLSTPQIPDWLYKLTRPLNEAAARSAADELGREEDPTA